VSANVFGDKGNPERLRLLSHIRSGRCAAIMSSIVDRACFCPQRTGGREIFCSHHLDHDPGRVDVYRALWREAHERFEEAVKAADHGYRDAYEEGYEDGLAQARRLAPDLAREISAHKRMVTVEMRREVLRRDGRRCARCGSTDAVFHIDHIVPFALGGACAVENLQVLCEPCNVSKGARFADYRPLEEAA
jgi:5-methylcytosine-specific restriction endonuclease McrA